MSSHAAGSARFWFATEAMNMGVGNVVKVVLRLDVKDVEANALEAEIVYPEHLFFLEETSDAGSIVSYWIEHPKESNGRIRFSGIIPGGYRGNGGVVISLTFRAIAAGEAKLEVEHVRLLSDDGKAAELVVERPSLSLMIGEIPVEDSNLQTDIEDHMPPELFVPVVGRAASLFEGQWFVAFSAHDKGSGIDRYEVQERRFGAWDPSKWIFATSPYALKDQSRRSRVYVRAVDGAGNARVVSISPKRGVWRFGWVDGTFLAGSLVVALWHTRRFSRVSS